MGDLPTVTAAGASTLLSEAHRHRPDYFRTVARLVQQTALALEHAHEMGIIHRDIKPANLILDRRGNIWVTDFGLAQFHADANLTRTGDMMGTLRYMSPEQAAGDRVVLDHRTDIYSLGVTLYELLTLEPVFADADRQSLMSRILNDDPRAPRQLDPTIPLELETIVLKAISKAPHERYASAQALADDLQRFLEDKPILARRPTLLERAARWRRRHRSVVVSAVVLLVLSSLGFLASTIVIAREHADTKKAYVLEAKQREAAEESFRQARKAVDGFTELAEQELAGQPILQPVRRKFLELTLEYYRNFIQQRSEDPDPTIRAELAATSAGVARIVDELDALQRFAPLMLLADHRVQQDLGLSTAAAGQIETVLVGLAADANLAESRGMPIASAANQRRAAELLRSAGDEIRGLLEAEQLARLEQIAWQQRGPFAFLSPELASELKLTGEQRNQIRAAIERTRPMPGGPGPGHGGPGGPPPDGFGHGGFGPGGQGYGAPERGSEPGGRRGPGGPGLGAPGMSGPGNGGPGKGGPGMGGPGRDRPDPPPDGFRHGLGPFDDRPHDELGTPGANRGREPGGRPPREQGPGRRPPAGEERDDALAGPGPGPGPRRGPVAGPPRAGRSQAQPASTQPTIASWKSRSSKRFTILP